MIVNLAVYRQLDDRRAVLQVVRDVPAGSRLAPDDLRPVQVGSDASVRTMPAGSLALVVGQYAKVRLVSGSLVVAEALQPRPLVADGAALIAVTVAPGELPAGLRERSRVTLVVSIEADPSTSRDVQARMVGLPSADDSIDGDVSITLEVAVGDASAVVRADSVHVVLLDPGSDPANDTANGPIDRKGTP